MSAVETLTRPDADLAGRLTRFLYREARLLDDRRWDDWLECYAPDASYWMPAWTDEGELTSDPQREISLIYYPNRRGLEDRVYRLRTGASAASSPLPRTCHLIANVEVTGTSGDRAEVRYNWHTLSHRLQQTAQFFGTTYCTIDLSGETPRIVAKRIVLKDDYIHQVIDFYHV